MGSSRLKTTKRHTIGVTIVFVASSAISVLPLTSGAAAPAPISAAAKRSANVLSPAGKWRVDYGLNECRLIRPFGDPTHPTTLQLSRVDPNPDFAPALAIAAQDLRPSAIDERIDISAEGHAKTLHLTGSVLSVVSGAPPIAYSRGAGPLADVIQSDIASKQATTLTVSVRNVRIGLALGAMEQPLRALDRCMDDLVRTWGYDPDGQRALTRRAMPITPTNTWLNEADYPLALASELRSGGVTVRLDVSASGAIVGCHVMEAGGDPAFEQLTCDVAKKNGRFAPALDRDGKPVPTYFPLRVIWKARK